MRDVMAPPAAEKSGDAKLIDFGLARLVSESLQSLDHSSRLLRVAKLAEEIQTYAGTMNYKAPEQFEVTLSACDSLG